MNDNKSLTDVWCKECKQKQRAYKGDTIACVKCGRIQSTK